MADGVITWYELNSGCGIDGLPACITCGMYLMLPQHLRDCYSIKVR